MRGCSGLSLDLAVAAELGEVEKMTATTSSKWIEVGSPGLTCMEPPLYRGWRRTWLGLDCCGSVQGMPKGPIGQLGKHWQRGASGKLKSLLDGCLHAVYILHL
jgi:hypothetical protein